MAIHHLTNGEPRQFEFLKLWAERITRNHVVPRDKTCVCMETVNHPCDVPRCTKRADRFDRESCCRLMQSVSSTITNFAQGFLWPVIARITSRPVANEWFRDGNYACCRHETIPSTPVTPLSADLTSPLSPTSAYFTTSEGKARFLTRYTRDVTVEGLTRQEDSSPPVVPTDSLDLRQKKVRNFLWKGVSCINTPSGRWRNITVLMIFLEIWLDKSYLIGPRSRNLSRSFLKNELQFCEKYGQYIIYFLNIARLFKGHYSYEFEILELKFQ